VLAGIDTHKDSLAVAVIDQGGRPLVVTELPNTETGFNRLEELLAGHRVGRVGIEGSGNYGRGAALRLVLAGRVEVVEVPPAMTSRERSGRPGQGKTDPVDAVAIARITAREPLLPPSQAGCGCVRGPAGSGRLPRTTGRDPWPDQAPGGEGIGVHPARRALFGAQAIKMWVEFLRSRLSAALRQTHSSTPPPHPSRVGRIR
jgi:hypothetical protein